MPTPILSESSVLRFLADASRCLSESLDYEGTLLAVAEMALPYMGSWCIVDIVKVDGSMRRLGIVHPDPAKAEHVGRLTHSWPPHRDDPLGLPRALLSRSSEVVRSVSDEMLVAAARSEENLRDLRALGIGSLLVVPMLPRGNLLGAITFVSAETGHQYDEMDLTLAEELASRCGIAVDNARLLREAEAARAEAEDARARIVQLNERLIVSSIRQQELAETAHDASQAKSRFLATMSHEIRSPINAIIGYMELLDLDIGEPTPRQRDYFRRMKVGSRHLISLTEDILNLAKIEAGRMNLLRQVLSASESVFEAVSMIEPQAILAGVSVTTTCSDGSYHFVGDGERVHQILLTLLSNALKYTDRGGSVSVSCGATSSPDRQATLQGEGPWTFFRVEDTGIGIPEGDAESVFETFVQLDTENARKQGGAGLGLAIALELAHKMGGDLTLRSKSGEGSCFTLWLPGAEEPPD